MNDRLIEVFDLLLPATLETIFMIFISGIFSVLLGLLLAIFLFLIKENGLKQKPKLYRFLDLIVNVFRSFPFVILMIVVLPLSKLIVGTKIGTTAAIVPLTISAVPFVARLFEQEFNSVDSGIIDAAKSMGASNFQIIFKVVIPESIPAMISDITNLFINLVGYSAMSGTVGGGGLGNLAIRYGYNRRENDVLFASVIVIIAIVQFIQYFGFKTSFKLNKK
ncbi:MAG: methionine ABC transporter permease [Peptoniphilaceae bacterium]|nr:ABC transporter permease [Peptoniphilaceae bacterium]MDD7383689.1 ABC transporter permease [Peptoniphilaceae bacterium]MDY3738786.1 methionine ABC transporter permease [Peptoniphilaceae bacterium]